MHFNILVAYLAIAALCWQFELTNSRTSTLWRLNNGKITGSEMQSSEGAPVRMHKNMEVRSKGLYDPTVDGYTKDHIFHIIATTLNEGGGSYNAGWIRQSPEIYMERPSNRTVVNLQKREKVTQRTRVELSSIKLDCGKPVNYTRYDNLLGVEQRHFYHPPVPEPEVAYLFLTTNDEYEYRNFDIVALERRLKYAKYEQQKDISYELYTEIGNYFRIIGDSRQAIECFRHAVAKRSHPEALRNLARVLYNLEYFSDAMRISLESINLAPGYVGYVPWQEYFILGEIFRASGRVQESSLHLRRALELYPHHEPILKVLRDVESSVLSSLHIYTLFIIIALVIAVFVVIISSSIVGDNSNSNGNNVNSNFCTAQFEGESRPQRHFNRAMAMRSLKRHRRF